MSNSKIFTDLELNDTTQLESALYRISINIDSPAKIKPILRNAGIDDHFIGQACRSGLGDNESITILVSEFKGYSVSSRNPDHPLNKLLRYLLQEPQKTPCATFNLRIKIPSEMIMFSISMGQCLVLKILSLLSSVV